LGRGRGPRGLAAKKTRDLLHLTFGASQRRGKPPRVRVWGKGEGRRRKPPCTHWSETPWAHTHVWGKVRCPHEGVGIKNHHRLAFEARVRWGKGVGVETPLSRVGGGVILRSRFCTGSLTKASALLEREHTLSSPSVPPGQGITVHNVADEPPTLKGRMPLGMVQSVSVSRAHALAFGARKRARKVLALVFGARVSEDALCNRPWEKRSSIIINHQSTVEVLVT
jgi:hypothetical protein